MKLYKPLIVVLFLYFFQVPSTSGKELSTSSLNVSEGASVVTPPVDPLNPTNPVVSDIPTPTDPDNATNEGTKQVGPLSVDYVSNISFGAHKIKQEAMFFYARNPAPFVQVTDNRGMKSGWTLNARISDFSSGKKKLSGAILKMSPGKVKGTNIENVSEPPISHELEFKDINSNYIVFSASQNSGKGTWINLWSTSKNKKSAIRLEVPKGVAKKNTTYKAVITWQLTNAPH